MQLADTTQAWGPFETTVQQGLGGVDAELVLYRKNPSLSHTRVEDSFMLDVNAYYRRNEREDWQRVWFDRSEAPPPPSAPWGAHMQVSVVCPAGEVACKPISLHSTRWAAAHYRWTLSMSNSSTGNTAAWLGDAGLVMLQEQAVTPFEMFEDSLLCVALVGGIGYFLYCMVWGDAAPERSEWTEVQYQTLGLGIAALLLANPFNNLPSHGIAIIAASVCAEWLAYAYVLFYILCLLDRFALDSESTPNDFYNAKAAGIFIPAIYFYSVTTLLLLEGWSPGTTVAQRTRRFIALILFVPIPIFVWNIAISTWGVLLFRKCLRLYRRRPYLDTTFQLTVAPTALVLGFQIASAVLSVLISRSMRRAVSNIITVMYALLMLYVEAPVAHGTSKADAAGLEAPKDDALGAILPDVPTGDVEL